MIGWSFARTADPALEPLSLQELKQHARIFVPDEDALLRSYIQAAREAAEQFMGRGLFTQTWRVVLDDWPEVLWLPMADPLQSITSVQYYAGDGTLTTLTPTGTVIDTTSSPGRLSRAPEQVWPALQADRLARVVITYVVGWPTIGAIPELIKQGCRLHATYSDLDRHGSDGALRARAAAHAAWTLAGRVWIQPPLCAA